jgi:hypothetical protein
MEGITPYRIFSACGSNDGTLQMSGSGNDDKKGGLRLLRPAIRADSAGDYAECGHVQGGRQ